MRSTIEQESQVIDTIKYGNVFKKLREQRQLPLSFFEVLGISKSTIGKFERGENMMSFDRVVRALKLLSVTLEEFECLINGYEREKKDLILEELLRCEFHDDKDSLQVLFKQTQRSEYKVLNLLVKGLLDVLDQIEIEFLIEYLYEIEHWQIQDLCVFYFMLEHLSAREALHLFDHFFKFNPAILEAPRYRNMIVQVAYKAVAIYCSRGQEHLSFHILKQAEEYNIAQSMFERTLKLCAQGYWKYCFRDEAEGNKEMVEGLNYFEKLAGKDNFIHYYRRYEKYIKLHHSRINNL